MSAATPPTVAAVVVSWNGLEYLKTCFQALRGQHHRLAQVVVVDNDSADGSLEWLAQQSDAELIRNDSNRGFAAANNQGIERCYTDFVLLVNPDVALRPDYIERCLPHFDRDDIGSVTGKLLRPSGVIDSTGHNVYGLGWAENRGEWMPDAGYDTPGEVFGVCAAAALYRSAALRSASFDGQVFDETFFAYIEDVDLDWRLRWGGWRAWYEPAAVAIHHRSATAARYTASVMRLILKNRILTVVKNYDRRHLLSNAPGLTLFTLAKVVDFGRRHPSATLGLADAARELPGAMRKRRRIQSSASTRAGRPMDWLLPYPWRGRARRRRRGADSTT